MPRKYDIYGTIAEIKERKVAGTDIKKMARMKQTKRRAQHCPAVLARIAAVHGPPRHSPPTHGPPTEPSAKKRKTTSKMTNIKNDVVGKAEDNEKKKSTYKSKSTGECQQESKNKGESESEGESKNWQEI
jgi:hypothetical protein